MPKSGVNVLIAVAAYTFLNFVFFARMEGVPDRDGRNYYLHNHGVRIRNITREEFRYHRALVVRSASGHWVLFASAATVAFTYLTRGGPSPHPGTDRNGGDQTS